MILRSILFFLRWCKINRNDATEDHERQTANVENYSFRLEWRLSANSGVVEAISKDTYLVKEIYFVQQQRKFRVRGRHIFLCDAYSTYFTVVKETILDRFGRTFTFRSWSFNIGSVRAATVSWVLSEGHAQSITNHPIDRGPRRPTASPMLEELSISEILTTPAWLAKLPQHVQGWIVILLFVHVVLVMGIIFCAIRASKRDGSTGYRPAFSQDFITKNK